MKYELRGERGPCVLLLHGLLTSGRLWDYLAPLLVHNFRCLIPDLPGAGESALFTKDQPNAEDYALAVETLRRELGIDDVHVVGHDAGSTIAVHYAVLNPGAVKSLTLCSPPLFPEHRPPLVFRLVRLRYIGAAFAPLVKTLTFWYFRRLISGPSSEEIVSAFKDPYRGFKGWKHFHRVLNWGDPKIVLARTAALLPHIQARTLILHGSKDAAIHRSFALRAEAVMPAAVTRILPYGHFLPLECPSILAEHLCEFLADVDFQTRNQAKNDSMGFILSRET